MINKTARVGLSADFGWIGSCGVVKRPISIRRRSQADISVVTVGELVNTVVLCVQRRKSEQVWSFATSDE
jgi:hypothetical protein